MEGKRSHKSRVKTLSLLYTHHVCGCTNYGLMRWLVLLKLQFECHGVQLIALTYESEVLDLR